MRKSKAVKTHQACLKCPSSDAATYYDDGHGHCFSCGKNFDWEIPLPKNQQELEAPTYEKVHKIRPLPEVYHEMADRGISAATAKKFNVTVNQDGKSNLQYVYPRFDKDGHHVANKLRYKGKEFTWEGQKNLATMFGQNVFPSGGKYITVTEGQDDAMAVYEMFGSRYPAVSVDSASEAVQNCKDSFEYLNSFETIILCFDADEAKVKPDGSVWYPGQEAALACAGMFPIGKVKILTLKEGKDANEYLLKRWAEKFTKEWWAAPIYTPSGLKLGKDMWDEIKELDNYETVEYPWPSWNEMTYGMRLSEVVLLTADTGVGKTAILKEVEHHIKNSTDKAGLGILHLEEPNKHTALGLMSITANKPLHLPDVRADVDDQELRKYFDATINSDRIVIWDHFGSNSVQEVLNKIRHMHVLGCKYIFLDHLSIVVSDQSGDERKQLDEISTKLKMICMELNIAVMAVIHINRAGLIRGSAGPEQIANIVLKLHRDKTDPDPWRRNVTKIVCEKNRFSGKTGPMSYLIYEDWTGRLRELSRDEIDLYESGGSPVPQAEAWV